MSFISYHWHHHLWCVSRMSIWHRFQFLHLFFLWLPCRKGFGKLDKGNPKGDFKAWRWCCFFRRILEEYAEEHADVHNTHTDLRHAIYIVYIYISIDTSILLYDVSNKHIYIYTYIYTCTYLCIRSLGSCVIIYVKMSKRRVNGPLMSLPKLSGQRSGRKGLQRFRKGLMHLLFRGFFFHLSLLPLVEHGNIGSITMAFPCFLGSTKTMENGAGLWKR